jgi:hypothetical protein
VIANLLIWNRVAGSRRLRRRLPVPVGGSSSGENSSAKLVAPPL